MTDLAAQLSAPGVRQEPLLFAEVPRARALWKPGAYPAPPAR